MRVTDDTPITVSSAKRPSFSFDVVSVSIREEKAETSIVVILTVLGLTNQDLMDLVDQHHLNIGMRFFSGHTRQRHHAERRGVLARNMLDDHEIFASFILTADDFLSRAPLIAKIDFVYEGDYWFEELRNSGFYVTMLNPMIVPAPRDVFDYYRSKTTGAI